MLWLPALPCRQWPSSTLVDSPIIRALIVNIEALLPLLQLLLLLQLLIMLLSFSLQLILLLQRLQILFIGQILSYRTLPSTISTSALM